MDIKRNYEDEENELTCPNCGFHYTRLDDIYSIIGNGCCEECIDELVESGVILVGNFENYQKKLLTLPILYGIISYS